jgi:predicted CoA-substrate-specific enzyme activase
MEYYLGIDLGSVSTNLVAINRNDEIIYKSYLRTKGQPIKTLQEALRDFQQSLSDCIVAGVGTTGSARHLAAVILGADVVKNEITAHAVAATRLVANVKTVVEIGGQDSKIIIIRNGVVSDFAMNTVCAAGTGSFLDQQASRLNISIEDFGPLALKSTNPVRIAGRCTVFAESDMIHKQQMGHSLEDILAGLCEALVRNYLSNVGKGKNIEPPIVFQGGVAANVGIKAAFQKALRAEIIVPEHFDVMGAIGAALLAKDAISRRKTSRFKGFEVGKAKINASSFECNGCANACEVVSLTDNKNTLARWGDKCGKWSSLNSSEELLS